jgi:hypothetical protein
LDIKGERKEVCKLGFVTVEEHQCVVLRVKAEYDSTLFDGFSPFAWWIDSILSIINLKLYEFEIFFG